MRLLRGPTGGGCAITSRELNERVGGFRQHKKEIFWLEDEAYIEDIERLGFEAAVLGDLRVHHTGGPHYTKTPKEKAQFWQDFRANRRGRPRSSGCSSGSRSSAAERALRLVRAALLGAAASTSTSPGTSPLDGVEEGVLDALDRLHVV